MFAPLKRLAGGGGGAELAQLQQENEELNRILMEYEPKRADMRVERLLRVKAEHHTRMRAVMERISDPVGPAQPIAQGFRSMCSQMWGTQYKRLGEMMECPTKAGQMLKVEFGQNMRKLYFDLEDNFLNSASYGATPRPVQEARRLWDLESQKNPVLWRVRGLPQRLREAEAKLSGVLGCDPANLRFMMNCNAATSAVLKALPWEVGDRLLTFSIDYDATKNACKWLQRTHGVKWEELEMVLPMTDDEIVELVHRDLQKRQAEGRLPKLVNFCHVTSKTAYIFPAKRLRETFHRFNVPVLIDGAQAAGHLDVNLHDIGSDWYVGTVHKWMYSNQGVAFIYAAPQKHAVTQPLTVSFFDGQGFGREFDYCGLQDFSTWCAVVEALEFVEYVCGGWHTVRQYISEQARQCTEELSRMWGTQVVQRPSNGENHFGNMPIVPLPGGDGIEPSSAAKVMGALLMNTPKITAFLLMQQWKGPDGKPVDRLCIRCSCQIYTDIEDWRRMGRVIRDMNKNYGAGQVISSMLWGGSGGADDGKDNPGTDTLQAMSA